jgi:hypothetical protein
VIRDETFLLKLNEIEKARLRALAQENEISMSQMIRQLIKQAAVEAQRQAG